MKVFVPMPEEWPLDPALACLPLVPFQLDFPCQRDLQQDGSAASALAAASFSDESPWSRPV